MTPERFRLVGWLVSGLCLAGSAGIILNRHAALVATANEEIRAGSELERARSDLAAVTRKPKDARFACAPRSANEETEFLLDLRKRAHTCGVSISRWTSHATDYKGKEGEADAAKKAVEGITKVTCDLVLLGPYASLRAFLADLWNTDRLLTVSHVDWNRTDKGSELSMSLGRYLAPRDIAAKP